MSRQARAPRRAERHATSHFAWHGDGEAKAATSSGSLVSRMRAAVALQLWEQLGNGPGHGTRVYGYVAKRNKEKICIHVSTLISVRAFEMTLGPTTGGNTLYT